MASVGFARAAMVMPLFRIYVLLASVSFGMAILWSSVMRDAYSMPAYMVASYQQLVGELDGRACPSYPVCSLYARQAMLQYGLFPGSWIALDRLIHEGGDLATGPFIHADGESRLYDTLERNTFWFGGHNDSEK